MRRSPVVVLTRLVTGLLILVRRPRNTIGWLVKPGSVVMNIYSTAQAVCLVALTVYGAPTLAQPAVRFDGLDL